MITMYGHDFLRCHMAAEMERYNPSKLPHKAKASISEIWRRADGTWMFAFDVDVEAALPDGRRVRTCRNVRVSGFQIGRKSATA